MPSLGPLNRPLRFLRRLLPSVNFLVLHWLYFVFTCLISAIIFWGSSTPSQSITFTNSLFFTVSAMTEAGLNPVNLSQLNTWQQVMLFLLILIGSPIWVSIYVIYVRRKAFRDKFASDEKKSRLSRSGSSLGKIKRWASTATSDTRTNGNQDVEKRNRDLVDDNSPDHAKEQDGGSLSRDPTPPERRGGPEMNRTMSMAEDGIEQPTDDQPSASPPLMKPSAITFRDDTQFSPAHPTHGTTAGQNRSGAKRSHSQLFSMQGVGARPANSLHSTTALNMSSFPSFQRTETMMSENKFHGDIAQYFHSASGWISRNSQFHNLTSAERDELGGYEYRAIEFLAWLVPAYLILWQLLGCLGCGAWVYVNAPDTARTNGLNPFWVGAFNAVSAFNNSGMSLLDANMVAFQRSYYMLITMSLLILAGNTAFPPFLRLIVWIFYKYYQYCAKGKPDSHPAAKHAQTLRFLLDHPRRCYTNLFPSQETWWLAASVFSLNAIDWAAFEILNIGNNQLTTGLPLRYRVIDGLFQAFAVRSGGFYVVTIPNLRISLLVLYVVMMYISVYPVVITIRNSNVYEERSLGIYAEEKPEDLSNEANNVDRTGDRDPTRPPSSAGGLLKRVRTIGGHLASLSAAQPAAQQETNTHFIQHQLRAQIAHDAWFIVLALFLIMIIEASRFEQQPVIFSVFNFIFEIVSAYGCVGISIGVPYADYSFSGAWRILSKLILCAVMLRGRHRGLPVAIDKAVMLPKEEQVDAEEEDGRIRIARSMTMTRWESGIQ